VSFAVITLCVASQRVFIVVIVYFVMTQSGNFWLHHRIIQLQTGLCLVNEQLRRLTEGSSVTLTGYRTISSIRGLRCRMVSIRDNPDLILDRKTSFH
jgi:hypothetical protein